MSTSLEPDLTYIGPADHNAEADHDQTEHDQTDQD